MTKFISDGCSVPKWKWLRQKYPDIDYWIKVLRPACVFHDWDHHKRKIRRWKSTANFRSRMYLLVYKHVYEYLGYHPVDQDGYALYEQGIFYADLFMKGVHVGGWFDWYVVKPLKEKVHARNTK